MKPVSTNSSTVSIRSARALATRLVPESGSLDEFVKAVGRYRHRPTMIIDHDYGNPYDGTGLWYGTERGDYIIVPADASPSERSIIVCHEIAHMLLGHAPAGTEERLQQLYTTLVGRLGEDGAYRALGRTDVAEEREAQAEQLATQLVVLLDVRADRAGLNAVSDRLR